MMMRTVSLPLSHDLKVHKIHEPSGYHNSVAGRNRLYLIRTGLSSCSTRQDVWSLHLLENLSGSITPVSSRCNAFICRSVLFPGRGNEKPILQATAVIFTRAYDAVRGNTHLMKLIPAVGILAFATWGIRPLLRFARTTLLEKGNDSSNNKSTAQYIVVSYIQPLLLWSGAILLCRTLDPIVLPSTASQAVKQRLLAFARSMSTVLAFVCCLSSLIQQAQKFFMETNNPTDTRNMGFSFAGKAVYTAAWVAAASLFMELLGFSTQKWLTAGGLGTVLLTLAGREILTNFLSSMMIHATRPFVLNEWIQTKIEGYEVSGTVEHVGWWSPTVIRGDDREAVHIPNHKFSVNVVRNLTQKTHWRIKTHLAISHLDVSKINNIVADMRKVLSKNPQIEQQKIHRRVFLESIDPENQALRILISCFVKTSRFEEYLCVKEAVLLDLLRVIRHHGARLATPIRTVQRMRNEAEVDSAGFSDIVFNQAALNRRFMLIEPSYKINSDDNTKSSPDTVQKTEEKDSQEEPTSVSASESKTETEDNKKEKPKTTAPLGSNSNTNTKGSSTSDQPAESKPEEKRKESTVESQKSERNDVSEEKDSQEEPTSVSASESKTETENESVSVSNTKKEKPKTTAPLGSNSNTSIKGSSTSTSDQPVESKPDEKREESTEKDDVSDGEVTGEQTLKSKARQQGTDKNSADQKGGSGTSSSLEENIVLGVALDGSKRTLPIDEQLEASGASMESEELGVGPERVEEKR